MRELKNIFNNKNRTKRVDKKRSTGSDGSPT